YVNAAKYKYYTSNGANVGDEISLGSIQVGSSAVRYWVEAVLTENASKNFSISQATLRKSFRVGSDFDMITVELDKEGFIYDGSSHGSELKVTSGAIDISKINVEYYKDSVSDANKLTSAPTDAGNYIIVLSLSEQDEEDGYALSNMQLTYTIGKASVKAEWDTSGQIPVIANLDDTLKDVIGYIYYDDEGNQLADGAELEVGKQYKVKAIIQGSHVDNYKFVATDGSDLPSLTETQPQDFTVHDNTGNGDGNNVGIGSGNQGGTMTFDNVSELLKQWWQVIASVVSIILIIIFISKGVGYANERKKAKKATEKYANYYAGATGLFGLAMSAWTAIACTLMGLAVLSFAYMMIQKYLQGKAQDELEEAKDEYERNKADFAENKRAEEARQRDESMRMMLMGMMGGNAGAGGQSQGGFVFAGQPSLGADEIRGIVSETMTAMLPGMQQMLPQQASANDGLVERLLEKTAKNEDSIQKLMKKIAEQPTERIVEREVAASSANDETIRRILDNQDKIMQKILELSSNQKSEPQVVEKIVEKEVKVEVPVEKIVEKVVEVPVEVEKIVEKEVKVEVPVEVEKIVEKEVVKEVKVEVPVAVPTPSKPKKEVAPRLTLDEAYTQLSKQQQKYFDGLRQYALSKPNSKEKKSTYFTVFGQSTVNPLMKLTIKKDTVVALFKMEDEYMKDIRRDATGDGTKIKVKETEVIISDAQACKAAKNMIDLREDQIERYQDLLKEQRALSKQRK
ncbi:MAG: hypothetical protein K2I23_05445, partial [Clostridia bacterium]|nr:hypothetical protein [Clostridia bacterium]